MAAQSARTRILLVDDSLLVQKMIREYFEPEGYEVLVAGNGREALELVRSENPKLIVSDIIMPVMDGWEFCEEIRSSPETADIPFLFLTAVREVPKRIQGLRMGADDYITKPFSREELLARVEVCLAKLEKMRSLQVGGDAVLSGNTSHMALSDLLQLLSLNSKSGVLKITEKDGGTGRVFLKSGQVINASLGTVTGRKALYRLLHWTEARFEMDPSAAVLEREAIREPTSNVLMDGFTHNDELTALWEKLPPPDARFVIAPGAARSAESAKLETTDKAVLPEFEAGVSLAAAMDRSPLADLEIGRAVQRLLEMKLLQPAE